MADQARTAEELKKIEFNYYNAFQIPLEETDVENIKKAINRLCGVKANSSNPVDIRLGKDLKADALAVMCDTKKRKTEKDRLQRLQIQEICDFELLRCRQAQTVVKRSELEQVAIKKKVDLDLLEAEFIKRLQAANYDPDQKYVDDTPRTFDFLKYPVGDKQKSFDFNGYSNVDKYLTSYQNGANKNLFQLLGLKSTCSVQDARTQLDVKKKANAGMMLKKTTDGVALKNLYGEAAKFFSGDEGKFKAYCKFIKIKDDVFSVLKEYKKNGMSLELPEYLGFLQSVVENLNEPIAEAADDLGAMLRYFSLKLNGVSNLTRDSVAQCGACQKCYVKKTSMIKCPHCRERFGAKKSTTTKQTPPKTQPKPTAPKTAPVKATPTKPAPAKPTQSNPAPTKPAQPQATKMAGKIDRAMIYGGAFGITLLINLIIFLSGSFWKSGGLFAFQLIVTLAMAAAVIFMVKPFETDMQYARGKTICKWISLGILCVALIWTLLLAYSMNINVYKVTTIICVIAALIVANAILIGFASRQIPAWKWTIYVAEILKTLVLAALYLFKWVDSDIFPQVLTYCTIGSWAIVLCLAIGIGCYRFYECRNNGTTFRHFVEDNEDPLKFLLKPLLIVALLLVSVVLPYMRRADSWEKDLIVKDNVPQVSVGCVVNIDEL